jgi:hypothetical protein
MNLNFSEIDQYILKGILELVFRKPRYNHALEPSTRAGTLFAALRGLSFPSANIAPVTPSPLLLRRRGFGRGLRLSAAFNRQENA